MTARSWVAAVMGGLFVAASASGQCVSTLVPVSQPAVFPNRAAGPIAWTGSFYGVTKRDTEATNAIWFAKYDANLNQVGAQTLVAASSAFGPRLLLWNGGEFAVFYQTPALQIVFQRIDANGNLIGGPSAVAPLHGVAPGEEYDAAWDPTRNAYVVLHTITAGFERGLWLTVVGVDGSQKSDEPVTMFSADPVYPRVAITPAGTIGITWSRLVNNGQQELAFGIVAPGTGPTSVSSVRSGGSNPRVATDGRFFLVVYSAPVGGGTVLRSVEFDTAGRTAGADAQLLSEGEDVVAFSLTANATLGEWGLLYATYPVGLSNPTFVETRLLRIFFSGAPPTDSPFPSDSTKGALLPQSELTWNGRAYVAAIGRFFTSGEGSESYLVRVCPLLVTATASATTVSPNVPVTLTANPSGGAPPYSFTWSFGDVSANVNGPVVTHAYRDLGIYTATVTATDANGSVTTSTIMITVANVPLVATATASQNPVLTNVPIALTANASGAAPPYSFTWSFGDGSANQSGQSVSHAYGNPGTYTATVTVKDINGSTTTAAVTITVASPRRRAANHP